MSELILSPIVVSSKTMLLWPPYTFFKPIHLFLFFAYLLFYPYNCRFPVSEQSNYCIKYISLGVNRQLKLRLFSLISNPPSQMPGLCKCPWLIWSCFSPQTPHIGGPGLANFGLSDDERLLVQRFDPSKLEGEIFKPNLDTIGFFIAKFAKITSWINTDL